MGEVAEKGGYSEIFEMKIINCSNTELELLLQDAPTDTHFDLFHVRAGNITTVLAQGEHTDVEDTTQPLVAVLK